MEPLTTEELYHDGADGQFGLYHLPIGAPPSPSRPPPPPPPRPDSTTRSVLLDTAVQFLHGQVRHGSNAALLGLQSVAGGGDHNNNENRRRDAGVPSSGDQVNASHDRPSISGPSAAVMTMSSSADTRGPVAMTDPRAPTDAERVSDGRNGCANVSSIPRLEPPNITDVENAFQVLENAYLFLDNASHFDTNTNTNTPATTHTPSDGLLAAAETEDDYMLRLVKFAEMVATQSDFPFYRPLDPVKLTEEDIAQAKLRLEIEARRCRETQRRQLQRHQGIGNGGGGGDVEYFNNYSFVQPKHGAGAARLEQDAIGLPPVAFLSAGEQGGGGGVCDGNDVSVVELVQDGEHPGAVIVESSRKAEKRAERPSAHAAGLRVQPPRADTASSWVEHNNHLLQSYASAQIHPPLGRRVSVELNEPTQLVTGMLQSLANRGKVTSDESEMPRVDLLEGYVDLIRWATEYFRTRFGMNHIDHDIATLLTVIVNNVYEAQMRLVDAIALQAVRNMQAEHRSSLRVDDFAFSFDLHMLQEMPFFVEASHRVRDTLEAHRPKPRALVPLSDSYTTQSGRRAKLSPQAQFAMKAAYEKEMKATASDSVVVPKASDRPRRNLKKKASASGADGRASAGGPRPVEKPGVMVHYTSNYGRPQDDTGAAAADGKASEQGDFPVDASAVAIASSRHRPNKMQAVEIYQTPSAERENVSVIEARARKGSTSNSNRPPGGPPGGHYRPEAGGGMAIPKIRIPARPATGQAAAGTASSSSASVTPNLPPPSTTTKFASASSSVKPAEETHVAEPGLTGGGAAVVAPAPTTTAPANEIISGITLDMLPEILMLFKTLTESVSVAVDARSNSGSALASMSASASASVSTPVSSLDTTTTTTGAATATAGAWVVPLPVESGATTPTVVDDNEEEDTEEKEEAAESTTESVAVAVAPVRRGRGGRAPNVGRRMSTRSEGVPSSSSQMRSRSAGVGDDVVAGGNRAKKRKLGD